MYLLFAVSPLNNDDKSLNPNTFDFPLPDMDVFSDLNALDDAALQRIIQANYEDSVYDYETSYVDPSNVDAPENDVVMFEDMHNCTETFWNVSLVPRALRKNPTYVLVSKHCLHILLIQSFALWVCWNRKLYSVGGHQITFSDDVITYLICVKG